MSLDNELRHALRRVPAPEGFAERIVARVKSAPPRTSARPGVQTISSALRGWKAIAATFLLAAILGSWSAYEMVERRREAAGQRAREQVLLALRITGEKLAHAQRGVRHITRQ
jgi:hypothetical protein